MKDDEMTRGRGDGKIILSFCKILLLVLLFSSSRPLVLSSPAYAASYEQYSTAVLRGVDKITGHVEVIEASVDDAVRFGTLYITVRSCQKTPPEETPETAAFLEIDEVKPDAPTRRWYSGWMFVSSAALSPLEHPVYDVWVVDCKRVVEVAAPPAEAPAQ
jgi:hypothetical protein